jgi:hypothetical protein
MAEYELVKEILNSCPNNQMRDISFEEIETEDPEQYVKDYFEGRASRVSVETAANGNITIFADCNGMTYKFIFTP